MCGITGFIGNNRHFTVEVLDQMVGQLNHRGPDDKGVELYKIKDHLVIGFAQARLSIIDLTSNGHQPMAFEQLNCVFNGEIYNHEEIKAELENLGHVFKTKSDTEVILHSFLEWGTKCVHRFIGMFAIVIHDYSTGNVYFMRDRAGVKPLFIYQKDNVLLFASEIKAFHKFPDFDKTLSESAVTAFFDFGYVPTPYCIFKYVRKIEAGSLEILNTETLTFTVEQYWKINTFYDKPKLDLSYQEAKNHTHELLVSACNYRMVADVPVGVFLSGGYDSTSVAAILQSNRDQKLKTFTIGFQEGNNEAPFAKEIAKHIGTDHHELYCTTREAQEIIPELPFFYDEPFADSSAIPTMLVSAFAKKQVTVALSADGGDEIFAGYTIYRKHDKTMKSVALIPNFIKPLLRTSFSMASTLVPASKSKLKHQLKGFGSAVHQNNLQFANQLYKNQLSLPVHIRNSFLKKQASSLKTAFDDQFNDEMAVAEMQMMIDFNTYLQNDILVKVDRATMSVSLEGREPLLDHRLIEFAAQLPLHYKFDNERSKKILKDIAHQYVPETLMDRPKTGFSIPIARWLRKDLTFLLDEFLSDKALAQSGLFNVPFVSECIKDYRKNKFHHTTFIWKLLMFQMWYAKWMS
ncbi:asparagine synthase (glutamine-hydrolyzing) [Flavobacterium aurantiibacter]|uniref:asparagine synthase (glutamine-hydrolyzing) n=1 Tax=Flavobacterium aurantiibacter TaxID=2023067 RepID=A0A255ZTA2_9FLAO|nr:asparagine synthase (glutamine-hydrolyzing) [Flavobacterium aurantiibacter]OYQ43950.1 asparagine synthase (glutamine-hydrolyzing) [Flavobacterium aurantiibacter]